MPYTPRAKAPERMRLDSLTLAVLWALAGCRQAEQRAAPAQVAAEAAVAAEAPLSLTPEKLVAYLGYQRAQRTLYASLVTTLEHLEVGPDGGVKVTPKVLSELERRAEGDDRAREASGLSEREVRQIEALVWDVLSARAAARGQAEARDLEVLEATAQDIPAEQRAGFEEAMAKLRALPGEDEALAPVRSRHGAHNVALVLARERELQDSFSAWLTQVSGGR
jgi:hypothetical protein